MALGVAWRLGGANNALLMLLGTQGVVLQPSAHPRRGSCLFTWNAAVRRSRSGDASNVSELCGASGCPPKACWLTEDCWLPEAPELDTARKGFASLEAGAVAHGGLHKPPGGLRPRRPCRARGVSSCGRPVEAHGCGGRGQGHGLRL